MKDNRTFAKSTAQVALYWAIPAFLWWRGAPGAVYGLLAGGAMYLSISSIFGWPKSVGWNMAFSAACMLAGFVVGGMVGGFSSEG